MRNKLPFSLPLVAPSLLAAKKDIILKEIEFALKEGASLLHFDVMDGHFVPNISFKREDYLNIKKTFPNSLIDTHLMVENPFKEAIFYAENKSSIVTIHLESAPKEEILKTLKMIKDKGSLCGLSIKPYTPLEDIYPYLELIDLVLIMSVEPGKGGQAYIPLATTKIAKLKQKREELNLSFLIEVDGGINDITGPIALKAGADILVAGSYLFNHEDFAYRMKKLL